jgi:hypothetical protein
MAWPVVEDGLRLDVHRVLMEGRRRAESFAWRWSWDGERVADISISVTLDGAASGILRLMYRCNEQPFDQRFELRGEPCRFGGLRWFAICPATGHRASKLYSLGGAGFHTRKRYRGVAYRTQRAPKPIDRVLMRRDRILVRKLKGKDPDWVPKPKWMRWKTYNRWLSQLNQAEARLDGHIDGILRRIGME